MITIAEPTCVGSATTLSSKRSENAMFNPAHLYEPLTSENSSWYLQVRDDKMIPYPAQQFMAKRAGATVVEVPGSHAIYVSNPKAVAALIEQAASGVK